MLWINICLLIISTFLLIASIINLIQRAKMKKKCISYTKALTLQKSAYQAHEAMIEELEKECQEKQQQLNELSTKQESLSQNIENLSSQQEKLKEQNCSLEKNNAVFLASVHERNKNAIANHVETLEESLSKVEQAYDKKMEGLKKVYAEAAKQYANSLKETKAEVKKEQSYRDNLLAARMREQEIKENKNYYTLQISEDEKSDILELEKAKLNLKKPRILSMLIWSTFFQKPMSALSMKVLKKNSITGIYKITNLKNDMCYIGQSVNIVKRWADHAKCGLGIDTPANNKLYKAMQEDGLWNFSWELLEECQKEQLNEKEKYYIEVYKSKDYGYNSSVGISK